MTQGALQTLAVVTGLALAAAAGRAAAPGDARASLNALRAGTDPSTAAVRRQIADGAADLARARAAADSAGLPLDPARLQRLPVAPALDAAPLYVRLWALRPHGRGLDLALDPPDPRFLYTPAQIASGRWCAGARPCSWRIRRPPGPSASSGATGAWGGTCCCRNTSTRTTPPGSCGRKLTCGRGTDTRMRPCATTFSSCTSPTRWPPTRRCPPTSAVGA